MDDGTRHLAHGFLGHRSLVSEIDNTCDATHAVSIYSDDGALATRLFFLKDALFFSFSLFSFRKEWPPS
jgi:hypothetical protein